MSYVGLYDDAGSRNTFYKIVGRKKLGFKSFQNKKNAEFAHKIQSGLAYDDMAPKVYGEVGRIRVAGELTDWGYLTEVAKPMAYCDDEDCDGDCCDSSCDNSIQIQELVCGLDDFWGLSYVDSHRANFGYIRRNKRNILVPIDFGIESFNGINEIIWGEVDWDSLTEDENCQYTCCKECRYV